MIHVRLPTSFSFVDIETTGTGPSWDRIIEIAILRVDSGKVTREFQSLVNPHVHVDPFIFRMTGIHPDELPAAPSLEELASTIRELLTDTTFVAHNVQFDYSFIKQEFRRLGHEFSSPHLCTVRLFRALMPGRSRYNLDSLIETFGLTAERRHRAWDDAYALWQFFQIAKTRFPKRVLEKAIKQTLRTHSIPPYLGNDVKALPTGAGVYIFYGTQPTPLYIGKSRHIKDRVMNHFYSVSTNEREMTLANLVRRVEAIPSSGEFSALLLESELIKKYLPLYNKKLRKQVALEIIKHRTTEKGYDSVELESKAALTPDDLHSVLAIAKNSRQAKELLVQLAKKFSLCPKLLGLEKTKGMCFASGLGTCRGACTGKESILSYNMRFAQAFAAIKIKPWPFTGPIIYSDSPDNQLAHLIHNWCVIAAISPDENPESVLQHADIRFDYDVYLILRRFLLNPNNEKSIHVLSKHVSMKNRDELALAQFATIPEL